MKLVDAEQKYLNEYKEAHLLSLEKLKEGIITKHNFAFLNPDEVDVVKSFTESRDPSKLKEGFVPSYDYFIISDEDQFLGRVSIRTELTPSLLQYGGHIGYAIHPRYWNMGYGTKALTLALEKAKDLIDGDRVLITCDDTNIASSRIIEKNGGILENKVSSSKGEEQFLTRRYWVPLQKSQ